MKQRQRRNARARDAAIIQALIAGERDLARLSAEHFPKGGALRQLAEWYRTPEIADMIAALRGLAEDRTDLVVAHARATAALRMLQMAGDTEHRDSARKACFDLLKLPGVKAGASAGRRERAEGSRDEPRAESAPEDDAQVEAVEAAALLARLAALDAALKEDRGSSAAMNGAAGGGGHGA
jgi:hypothetical protein